MPCRISLLALPIASLLVVGIQNPREKAISDDQAVIETTMLSFYPKSDWNSSDWSRGDFVVVRPKPLTQKRPNFGNALNQTISSLTNMADQWATRNPKEAKAAKAKIRLIREIERDIYPAKAPYRADSVVRIDTQLLDSRILIEDPKGYWFDNLRRSVKNRMGSSGKMRVIVSMPPPGYSRDGQFAVMQGYAPWSMHSADLIFILRRSSTGWKVVYADATYYD